MDVNINCRGKSFSESAQISSSKIPTKRKHNFEEASLPDLESSDKKKESSRDKSSDKDNKKKKKEKKKPKYDDDEKLRKRSSSSSSSSSSGPSNDHRKLAVMERELGSLRVQLKL